MIIKTLDYYPEHIKRIKEYIRLSDVYDSELQRVWGNIEILMRNQYIDTMDEATISKWEKALKITANAFDDLEDRRKRLKGYFASDLPYTEKKINEILTAMCGKDYELLIDRRAGTIDINLKINSVRLVKNVLDIIRATIPCDMELTISKLVIVKNDIKVNIDNTLIVSADTNPIKAQSEKIWLLDGSSAFNGSKSFCGEESNIKSRIFIISDLYNIPSARVIKITDKRWFLDGKYSFDGSRLFDAVIENIEI